MQWPHSGYVIHHGLLTLVALGFKQNTNDTYYTECPPTTVNTTNERLCLFSWSFPEDTTQTVFQGFRVVKCEDRVVNELV